MQGENNAKKEKEAKALSTTLEGEAHKLASLQATLKTVEGLSGGFM